MKKTAAKKPRSRKPVKPAAKRPESEVKKQLRMADILIRRIEAQRVVLANGRNKLRNLVDDARDIIEALEVADRDLEDGVQILENAVDTISELI